MMAHKVVLSSCSKYFKNLLKTNNHSHPLICLTGIKSSDLENILDYIYKGEVQIFQENIDKFLEIAQRLMLDGLLASTLENEKKNISTEEEMKFVAEEDVNPLFDEPKPATAKSDIDFNVPKTMVPYDSTSVDEVELKISEYLRRNDNGDYFCKLCGKVGGKNITNTKNHIETHLKGISFSCSICGKIFKSRNSLNCHKTVFHKNK